jgi:GNAT superfamily N-acetyltransferase
VGSSDLEGAVRSALEVERQFILALGGFALEFPGATLVTHERIPVPRFNFAQEVVVARERIAALFERSLDHYFQRALRPSFRVPLPVPGFLARALEQLGFRSSSAPLTLLLSTRAPDVTSDGGVTIRPAIPDELDAVVSFWSALHERDELRRAIDVAWHHPNPEETLVPWMAFQEEEPVSASLVYRFRSASGIFAVATRAAVRGQGAATALVAEILRDRPPSEDAPVSIWSESARLERRLERLGFAAARRYAVFTLPANAELTMPDPGPPMPPRWRPPRGR